MNVSETLLLQKLSAIIDFAESLPLEIITEKNTEPIYPVTIGEHLVSFALGVTLPHTWESDELETTSELLTSPLAQLDTGVDKPAVWGELFEANAEVKSYLNSL